MAQIPNSIEVTQTTALSDDFYDRIREAISGGICDGLMKFYAETGDNLKSYYRETKEAAERM